MDKYARLMQKLEIVNVELFKVCFSLDLSFPKLYIFSCSIQSENCSFFFPLNYFSWFSTLLQGLCQLFEMFFYYIFETFGQQNISSSGKGSTDSLTCKLIFCEYKMEIHLSISMSFLYVFTSHFCIFISFVCNS